MIAFGAVSSVGGGITGTINEPIDLNNNGGGYGCLQVVDAGTNVTFAGPINVASTSTIGGTSHFAITGNVTGSAVTLSKVGTNRLDWTSASDYAGDARVVSGTLSIAADTLQYSTLKMVSYDSGTLILGGDTVLGGLKGDRDLSLAGNSTCVSVGNNNQDTTYSAALSNTALKKIGTGTLTLTGANTYGGLTTVVNGTLDLGASAFDAVLNTAGTARGADIQGGRLVFDYSSTGVSPVDTVRNNLLTSYAAGSGSLLSGPMFTSTGSALGYGIGYADDPVAMTVTAQVAVYGDANLDGTVNILDLAALGQNWKQTGKHWADGDFNYDGVVNLLDLAILGQNWKQSLTGISI